LLTSAAGSSGASLCVGMTGPGRRPNDGLALEWTVEHATAGAVGKVLGERTKSPLGEGNDRRDVVHCRILLLSRSSNPERRTRQSTVWSPLSFCKRRGGSLRRLAPRIKYRPMRALHTFLPIASAAPSGWLSVGKAEGRDLDHGAEGGACHSCCERTESDEPIHGARAWRFARSSRCCGGTSRCREDGERSGQQSRQKGHRHRASRGPGHGEGPLHRLDDQRQNVRLVGEARPADRVSAQGRHSGAGPRVCS
jgi:hypothetical protein